MNSINRLGLATFLVLGFATTHAAAAEECGLKDLDPIALDKNQNAKISREEVQGTTLAWAFDKVDTNGDGVIGQPEFSARCSSYQSANTAASKQTASKQEKEEPSAVGEAVTEKAARQKQRQASKVEGRVDQETNKAVDSVIDRGLDSLFGN